MERKRIYRNHGPKPPRYEHRVSEYKRLWNIWHKMKHRCMIPEDSRYHQYGGRGISVCQSWLESFDNFVDWALANGYADDLTIERVDVNGNYCPENCTWITRQEQAYNKRDTIWIDYKGRHIQLKKLCNEKGLNYDAINNRIVAMKWDPERAIDEPLYTNEGSLMSACKERGLNYGTVHDRIVKLGWTRDEALSVPTGRGRRGSPMIHGDRNAICDRCGTPFIKMAGGQRFCCAKCREDEKKDRRKLFSSHQNHDM